MNLKKQGKPNNTIISREEFTVNQANSKRVQSPRQSQSASDSREPQPQNGQNGQVQIRIENNKVAEDEALAYIPFDEPDEFNLLDEEYKQLAMKFVSENDDFISEAMVGSADGFGVNINHQLLAREVMDQELKMKTEALPDLQGWVEKKSPNFVRGWQKRWVIVREFNLFYGKSKADISDTSNEQQREQFRNAIPLLVVQYIVATDHSRSGRKFEIVARDPRTGDRRHYQWRASSREECEKWVSGLNEHKKLLAARLQFLAMNDAGGAGVGAMYDK